MAYVSSHVTNNGRGKRLSGFEYSHQHSTVAGEVPDASSLGEGEIAINLADGLLYVKNSNGSVVQAGSRPKQVALTYAATLNTNAAAGDIFDVTLTGNATLANPTNPVSGKTLRWRITQDGTGSRTVTLGNKFVIPTSATSPLPFSTAANKMDVLAATYHAGRDKWDVIAFVPGY